MEDSNSPTSGTTHRHRRSFLRRTAFGGTAAVLMTALSSCINPDVVNKQGGNLYPLAPGEQPFVLVTIINDTTAEIDLQVQVDTGALQPTIFFFEDVGPEERTAGVLLPYPFLRVAIGPLDSPITPSITATMPDGLTIRVPFGQAALVAGTDFNKGDTIIFEMIADSRSPTAISVKTGIIDGQTQTGPFRRSSTFETVTALLLLNGLGGAAVTGQTGS